MACLFGARLAPFAQVTLMGTWREGLQALGEKGIVLEEKGGLSRIPVAVTDTPEVLDEQGEALVVVKSWQTARACQQLRHCLSREGIALTLQNGLGNVELLGEILGEDRAALGVTTHGATLLGPGHVRVGGYGTISLESHPRLQTMESLFNQAGLGAEQVEDLQALIWGKLVVNVGINALTALLQVPNGQLLERDSARRLMEAAAREAAEVARAKGVRLPMDDPGAYVAEVARRTSANRSSMLQDILRGAPTEIDAINGALVQEAERMGLQVPLNWALTELVRAVRSTEGEIDGSH